MKYLVLLLGFLIIAATAGESDLNPDMPIWQFLLQSILGLALMGGATILILDTEESGK